MLFEQWAKVLVGALRELLPEILATRKGGVVTLRHRNSERVVTITEDAGAYWIKTTDAGALVATLQDSEQTAKTFAQTIAGGFDPRLSV